MPKKNLNPQHPPMIYVAGPYRGLTKADICININRARFVATVLWQKGYHVFCPHLNTGHFDNICRDNDKIFLDYGLRMVEICDAICLVPWWETSEGTAKEISLAKCLGKTIYENIDGVPTLPGSRIDRDEIKDIAKSFP